MLKSPVPVMVHFWPNSLVDFCSGDLAPVVENVAYDFNGKLTAVRTDAVRCPLMCLHCSPGAGHMTGLDLGTWIVADLKLFAHECLTVHSADQPGKACKYRVVLRAVHLSLSLQSNSRHLQT